MIALWGSRVDSGVSALRKNDLAVVIKTFDLPRMGGTLEWARKNSAPIRWQIPTKSTGYQQVLDALDDYNSGNWRPRLAWP